MNRAFTLIFTLCLLLPAGHALYANFTVTEVGCICELGGQGSILVEEVTPGDSGPYTFSWEGPLGYTSEEQSPTNLLVSGEYILTITNRAGCGIVLDPVTVSTCPRLEYIDFEILPVCDEDGGNITAQVFGGAAPYDYQWSNGATTQNLSGVSAGTYELTVTDGNGCEIVESVEVVSETEDPVSLQIDPLITCLCSGGNDFVEAFNVNVTGGSEPYTYEWTGPNSYISSESSPMDITLPGQYFLTVTSSAGCSVVETATIPACPVIQIDDFQAEPACGANLGSLTVMASGGTGVYSYEWSNGGTAATNNNLLAGTYEVTITDEAGCQVIGSGEVPTGSLEVSAAITPACQPGTGAILLDVQNAVQPVNIEWSIPDLYGTLASNLSTGSYSATVTDANGCEIMEIYEVPGGPELTADVTLATCEEGAFDGRIDLMINGSESNQITWSDGSQYDGLALRTGLEGGAYSVTVVSSDGCQSNATFSTTPDEPQVTYPYLKKLTIKVQGNITIYEGEWVETATGCFYYQGGTDLSQLSPNLLTAMADGQLWWRLEAEFSEEMDDVFASTIIMGASTSLTSSSSGNLTWMVTLMGEQVQQFFSAGNEISQEFIFTGISMGGLPIYDLWQASNNWSDCTEIPVIDPVSCVWQPTVNVNLVGDDTHVIKIGCTPLQIVQGGSHDELCIAYSGQLHPTDIIWTTPQGNEISGVECLDVGQLGSGEYCVEIQMPGSCVTETCINFCKQNTIEATINTATCDDTPDGEICLYSDTNEPFTVLWENGSEDACLEGVIPANYCVSITNLGCDIMENGSPTEVCYDLTAGDPITFTTEVEPSCPGQNTGTACVSPMGGAAPYLVTWFDGSTGFCKASLLPGCHSFEITDACGTVLQSCVEVPVISIEDISVTFLEPSEDACTPELGLDIASDGPVTVVITHNTNGTTRTQGGTGVIIFEDIPIGNYTVTITNECGAQVQLQDYVEEEDFALFDGIIHHGWIQCVGGTGMFTVSLLDEGTPPYSILWSNGGTTETITGLLPGFYSVTVTDAEGCSTTFGTSMFEANDPIEVEASISSVCHGGDGAISLEIVGGVEPYTYQWNNGVVAGSLRNLTTGEYCVTITDAVGCTYEECYILDEAEELLLNADINYNICSNTCNGSIDLEVNTSIDAISFQWDDGSTEEDLVDVCAGNYDVTITSGGCGEVHSFNISNSEGIGTWDYEVEVVWNFYSEAPSSNNAYLIIHSDVFTLNQGGDIFVSQSPDMSPVILSQWVPINSDFVRISIPATFSHNNGFYFTYETDSGCVYFGEIDKVSHCSNNQNDKFTFSAKHTAEEDMGPCEEGQSHTYSINVLAVGSNAPYFIKVTMEAAAFESEADYEQIVEYPGNSSFEITGVPSGVVKFSSYNHCRGEYHPFNTRYDKNCCFDFDCEVISNVTVPGGDRRYSFPYFSLNIDEECFDGDCGGVSCSNIWIDPIGVIQQNPSISPVSSNGGVPPYDCWTGTVTIQYPGVPGLEPVADAVFEVVINGFGAYATEWVSGDDNWRPPGPGTYFVTITYTGTGSSVGENCETDLEVNFYGLGNFNDAVALNGDFYFDYSSFFDEWDLFSHSYYGAWACETCEPEELQYIFDANAESCNTGGGYNFTYFHFEPSDVNSPDPCNSGGSLTIVDFDDYGNAVVQEIDIEATGPNAPLVSSAPFQPLPREPNIWYENAGWCLFDSEVVYGFPFENGKAILATWYDENSNVDISVFDPPTPEDCPTGLTYYNGSCVELCNGENSCSTGACNEDGVCVPLTDDNGDIACIPSCPPLGFSCIEGNCIPLDVSTNCSQGLIFSRYQCGLYINPCTFTFNGIAGDILRFQYRTYAHADQITVSIGNDGLLYIPCETIGTGNSWQSYLYEIDEDNPEVTINVVSSCGEGIDYFDWQVFCGDNFTDEDVPDALVASENGTSELLIYPNPFSSNLTIIAPHVDEPFEGEILLMDFQGRAVFNEIHSFEAGHNRYESRGLGNLPDGFYMVMIKREGMVLTSQKVVKMNGY